MAYQLGSGTDVFKRGDPLLTKTASRLTWASSVARSRCRRESAPAGRLRHRFIKALEAEGWKVARQRGKPCPAQEGRELRPA